MSVNHPDLDALGVKDDDSDVAEAQHVATMPQGAAHARPAADPPQQGRGHGSQSPARAAKAPRASRGCDDSAPMRCCGVDVACEQGEGTTLQSVALSCRAPRCCAGRAGREPASPRGGGEEGGEEDEEGGCRCCGVTRQGGVLRYRFLPFRLWYFLPLAIFVGAVVTAMHMAAAGFDREVDVAAHVLHARFDQLAAGIVVELNRKAYLLQSVSKLVTTYEEEEWVPPPILPSLDILLMTSGASAAAYMPIVAGPAQRASFEAYMATYLNRSDFVTLRLDGDARGVHVAPAEDEVTLPIAAARPPGMPDSWAGHSSALGTEGLDTMSMDALMLDTSATSGTAMANVLDCTQFVSGPLRLGDDGLEILIGVPVFRLDADARRVATSPDPDHYDMQRYEDPPDMEEAERRVSAVVATVHNIRAVLRTALLRNSTESVSLASPSAEELRAGYDALVQQGMSVVVEDVTDVPGSHFSSSDAEGVEAGFPSDDDDAADGDAANGDAAHAHGSPEPPPHPPHAPHPQSERQLRGRRLSLHVSAAPAGCGQGLPLLTLFNSTTGVTAADVEAAQASRDKVLRDLSGVIKPHLVDDRLRAEMDEALLACNWMAAQAEGLHADISLRVGDREWVVHVHGDAAFKNSQAAAPFSSGWVMWPSIAVGGAVSLFASMLALAVWWTESTATHGYDQAQRRAAEAAHRTQESVLSFACHELRNPLHAISASCEVLKSTVPAGAEPRQDVDAIGLAVAACQQVVDDILDLTALRSGRLRVNAAPLDVRHMMRQLALQNRSFARVPIVVHVSDALPDTLMADGLRLRQLLTNGLTNSCKHVRANPGLIVLRAWLEEEHSSVSGAHDGAASPVGARVVPSAEAATDTAEQVHLARRQWLCMEVVDTGPGLQGTDPERLFEAFSQNAPAPKAAGDDDDGAPPTHSTGLGLPICRLLARALMGEVDLRDRAAPTSSRVARQARARQPLILVAPNDLNPLPMAEPRRAFGAGAAGDAAMPLGVPLGLGDPVLPRTGAVFSVRVPVGVHAAGGGAGGPRFASARNLLRLGRSRTATSSIDDHDPVTGGAARGDLVLRSASGAYDADETRDEYPPAVGIPLSMGDAAAPAASPARLGHALQGMHFVIADDDRLNRRILTRMLASLGATSHALSDGDQVLPHLRECHAAVLLPRGASPPASTGGSGRRLDGIILDNSMARMSGLDVCRRLRREYGVRTRIVLASGVAGSDAERQLFADAGFDEVLVKPYDRELLAHAMLPKPQGAGTVPQLPS